MNTDELKSVAAAIVAREKGILAADESSPTIKKRFASIGVESTEENRRRYRELLFTAEGIERHISGVILYDETIRQSSKEGVPFPQVLAGRGIIPGIKVDKSAKPLALQPGNKITEGLDSLRDRLAEYKQLGAKFAKWRAVMEIDEHSLPSAYAIRANCHALARYAALCQEASLVPIVEPEVLMDGAHDIGRCESITSAMLETLFGELDAHGVVFEGALLKPNMVIPGKKCALQASSQQVAEATIRCLRRYVPAAVPGIVFLSGGQSPEEATDNLNAMNVIRGNCPWQLSFSYGRALQEPVLAAWKGEEKNVAEAQRVFSRRCQLNGLAREGLYNRSMEDS
ncbi:fructose-bisphosphate aldolase [Nitrosospira multiformis ATCC 25196]|uniref:Fructose-bisphosphate aldolase n=1 Tax=Nitrosospira multiformis (strain ATCC 25196 / NCIMB 11849 / C 71) TaxID=323848 RepID=Q2Y8Q7_NITMU|nr:class I fructose-bisphosphate aldolase [Nitrosospira multiformis]ABB74864.1 fructose-bisphosphate aldolase [Nitrosospira multiformis ATCC 25196]SEF92105.1 fructose-bisphosphate aldolase [Nitrosospira multiformis ATCC 25196]